MITRERAEQISTGVFLVGLGILFASKVSFWPGILFVLGASSLARGMAEGKAWYTVSGGLWLIGLGVVFTFGFSLPLLLILVGLTMLVGYSFHNRDDGEKEKRKNDDPLNLSGNTSL